MGVGVGVGVEVVVVVGGGVGVLVVALVLFPGGIVPPICSKSGGVPRWVDSRPEP